MKVDLKDTFIVKKIMTGVGKRTGRKWVVITPDGIDKINIFVNNTDIELSEGDTFIITKIVSVNYNMTKKGDKFFSNYSCNCEIAKANYDISVGDNDLDDLSADDISKVLK